MISHDIICSRCGWRNEPTARMCGGCGTPLTTNSNGLLTAEATPTSLNVQTPIVSDVGATTPATPTPLFEAARQAQNYTAPIPASPSYGAVAPVAVVPTMPSRTAGNRAGSMAVSVLIALVLLVVLGAIGYSSWGLLIQPGIQSQADAELNARMDTLITTVIPTHAGSVTVGADAFNRALAAQPQDSGGWLRDLRVHLYADELVFTYHFLTRTGSIVTHLEAVNGRLMVWGTIVYDALSEFETGAQVETVLNAGFGLLPASARYTAVTTVPGSVLLTIAGNGR